MRRAVYALRDFRHLVVVPDAVGALEYEVSYS